MSISAAKSRVMQAKMQLESGRTDDAEATLLAAERFLEGLSVDEKAPVVAELAAIRAEIASRMRPEEERNLSAAKNTLRQVRSQLESKQFLGLEDTIAKAERFLQDVGPTHKVDVVKDVAALREQLRTATGVSSIDADTVVLRSADRASGARATVDPTSIKTDALARALPILRELEAGVASDPFEGLEQREAYVATRKLYTLKDRVEVALGPVAEDDEDVKAIRARLVETDRKIEKASAAWGKAELDAQVGGSWMVIQSDIEGWDLEAIGTNTGPLEEPRLPKTQAAIHRIGYLLADPETKRIRDVNRGDPTLDAVYRTAEATFEAAAAKLDAAFNKVLDEAEKLPTPMRRLELDRPALLAFGAEYAFKGTSYLEANVARARKLDERWKAELAAIMKTRQALYAKLAAEADAAWPALVERTGAHEEFDPTDVTARGKVVLLRGVYNRSGWDFGGRDYDFAMRFDGTPVGASYEPHVLKALEHAWYELKLDVNDRIPWDVIGVVDGGGKIGEKTIITLRSKDTGLEIGKLEEFRPVDCIRLKIIGLHAGPVAVGPVE